MRSFLQVSAAGLTLLMTGLASAQAGAEDKAAAEALFEQGLSLLDAGKVSAACPKLEQSQRIDPGIGTLLYLGDCYERAGRIASAWATFREASSTAAAAGQEERAKQGQARADKLEARLSRLTVRVAKSNLQLEGLEITRGSIVLRPALFGAPIPVDAGEHEVTAAAPGYEPFRTTILVPPDAGVAEVVVPPLQASPASAPPAPAPEPPPATVVSAGTPMPDPAVDAGGKSFGTASLGLFVVGAVGAGLGTYFGLRAISKNKQAEEYCPNSPLCDDEKGVELTSEAQKAALVSNVSFGVGLAAITGGLIVYLTSSDETAATARVLSVSPLVGGAGLALSGSF